VSTGRLPRAGEGWLRIWGMVTGSEDRPTREDDLEACLAPGKLVDSGAATVVEFAGRVVGDARGPAERARRLYRAVRDEIRYDPYRIGRRAEEHSASVALERGLGLLHPEGRTAGGRRP